MKGILITILVVGIILIVIELVRVEQKCPTQQIIYRYIPRTFEEEQAEPVAVTDIFRAMFTAPDTWIGTVNDTDTRKREAINKYYISQQ